MATTDDSSKDERVSMGALAAMIAIVIGLLMVAVYANWQNAHRDAIDTTTVTRFTPAPAASPSATP